MEFSSTILQEAVKRYGAEPNTARLLGGFSNNVYECEREGKAFVLKILRREDEKQILGELDWMNYLSDRGVSLAKAVASPQGQWLEPIDDGWLAVAYEKAEGRSVDVTDPRVWNAALFTQWGEMMGRMHALTKEYTVSNPLWKRAEFLEGELFEADAFPEAAGDAVRTKWLQYRADLLAMNKDRHTYGMIHNDLHQGNFFVNGSNLVCIDFGDCEYSWFVYDIAISLYHAILSIPAEEQEKRAEFARYFLAHYQEGYEKQNHFEQEWIKQLPYFLTFRQAFSYVYLSKHLKLDELSGSQKNILLKMRQRIENDVPFIAWQFDCLQELPVYHILFSNKCFKQMFERGDFMMKEAISAFLRKPTTIVGVVIALMFQLIFSVVWMTGYDGVSENVNRFRIAVVTLDQGAGSEVAGNLAKQLPFQVVQSSSLEAANAMLESRQVQMVVAIPNDFTQKLQTPESTATIQYTVNESNPAMVKSVMQSASTAITSQVNREATAKGLALTFEQMNLPREQAGSLAVNLSERVVGSTQSIHPVGSFSMQMVPMMMVLASYVGSMIMCLNVQQSAMMLGGSVVPWKQFSARLVINGVSSVLVALVGTTLLSLLGDQTQAGFVIIWSYLALIIWTFLSVAQIFLLWVGPAGMLFNILVLSVQLVTSGAMVPRELLSGFYQFVSDYLPATYAVEGLMNLLFGGPDVLADAGALAVISVVAVFIGAASVAVKQRGMSSAAKGAQAHGQTAS